MAESAVVFLLNKLGCLAEYQFQLVKGVWDEILYLRVELESIRALLRDADKLEDSDEELRVWVKQVRDVAYDAEDVVDEFVLLQAYYGHGGGISGCLHKLSCCVRNIKAQYRIAQQLESVNSRIRKIFAAHRRLRPKFNDALKGSSFSGNSGNTWHDRREDALF
ncbi:hypothetical protein FNV43_RR10380 [Rhamnella rubrinervis]|nr:hypothetical protein FNV43_RR10380 [Rhamnella rubrinervis]